MQAHAKVMHEKSAVENNPLCEIKPPGFARSAECCLWISALLVLLSSDACCVGDPIYFSAGTAMPRMMVRCVNRKISSVGMLVIRIDANTVEVGACCWKS